MLNKELPDTDQHSRHLRPAEIPVLCLRLAQWIAGLTLICDMLAWVSAGRFWFLAADCGLGLSIALAGVTTGIILMHVMRGQQVFSNRRQAGFYGGFGVTLLNVLLRGGMSAAEMSLGVLALSALAFALLLWAGAGMGSESRLTNETTAGQDGPEPPTGVY